MGYYVILVICSKNNILSKTVFDNLNLSPITLYSAKEINEYALNKIDILILDINLENVSNLFTLSKVIVNTTQIKIDRSISIKKPFNLSVLLKIIVNCQQDKTLYSLINNELIYNEKESFICDTKTAQKIFFTNKENEIFRTLLNYEDFSCSKRSLLEQIWSFNYKDFSVLDFHLNRLKQKFDMISIDGSNVSLLIKHLS